MLLLSAHERYNMLMKKTIQELEINGKKYSYVVITLGGKQRFYVMVFKQNQWETFCSANDYGYKTIEAARRAFDNRLFFAEHYEADED